MHRNQKAKWDKLMKKFSVVVGLMFIFSGSTQHSVAASTPKVGGKCVKAGQTQVVGNKKFSCIKSGSKLTWNKGVTVTAKVTPSTPASSEPSTSPVDATPSASATSTPSAVPVLVKYKNCTEVKAAGAAPLSKSKTPELYELNAGLDRDKDGVACES